MIFDFEGPAKDLAYKLLTATIVPRPIAWVVSQSETGQLNAAPFSFFNLFGDAPPVVGLGVALRNGAPKDTLANIRTTGHFQICMVPSALAKAMNHTAINAPQNIDELALAGLRTQRGVKSAVPRIAEAPVAMECVLRQEVATGPAQTLLIAEVLSLYVDDAQVLDPERGHIATEELDLIARMQGLFYAKPRETFALTRPVWPQSEGS